MFYKVISTDNYIYAEKVKHNNIKLSPYELGVDK